MTTINDLETRINDAEDIVVVLNDELAELKTHLQELKAQEQPEPESLFGRLATHKEHGRVLILSDQPDEVNAVTVVARKATANGLYWVANIDNLTLDPVTIKTVKDFNDAPEGTIAEIMVEPKGVYVKKDGVWFGAGEEYPTAVQSLAKARVIRWGNGQ